MPSANYVEKKPLGFIRSFFVLNSTCLLFLSISLFSCHKGLYTDSNKRYKAKVKELTDQLKKAPAVGIEADSLQKPATWVGTVNFGARKPNLVVLHHTAQQSCTQTLQTFTKEKTQVSAHYVICADGTLYHMLHNELRAWHAGLGRWGNSTDVNSASIGIEIDNDGIAPYKEAQLQVLLVLLDSLKSKYNIPTANFIAHADVAPSRKVDPGLNFPWERLAEKGFGLWYGDTSAIVIPNNFMPLWALKIIGYDVRNYEAAVKAFRLHFMRNQNTGELSEPERKILYALMLKSME